MTDASRRSFAPAATSDLPSPPGHRGAGGSVVAQSAVGGPLPAPDAIAAAHGPAEPRRRPPGRVVRVPLRRELLVPQLRVGRAAGTRRADRVRDRVRGRAVGVIEGVETRATSWSAGRWSFPIGLQYWRGCWPFQSAKAAERRRTKRENARHRPPPHRAFRERNVGLAVSHVLLPVFVPVRAGPPMCCGSCRKMLPREKRISRKRIWRIINK